MKYFLSACLCMAVLFTSCKKDPPTDPEGPGTETPDGIEGYSIMARLPGIWNGAVTSTTALGGYAEWIVDFRPVSENQVSAKNELDELNDIHMSFFTIKHNNRQRVCFRNGGGFAGMKRVSYFAVDSVSDVGGEAYYRFSELIKGKQRAYTEVLFKQDSLILRTYTNKNNQLAQPVPHMAWRAKLQDQTTAQEAVNLFQFPKETVAKDFSATFAGQTEAVYYTLASDPYPESQQPYLGQSTINFSFAPTLTVDNGKKVFIIITVQPLINGITLNPANMKFRSRYVRVAASAQQFLFNYMHPGNYFVYALYDNDGNNNFSSGDYVSTQNTGFTLAGQGTATANVQMNFMIP